MSSYSSILILGAGVYQLPLIQKSHEMGFRTIVVSPHGNYPGIKIADEVWDIDTTNVLGIIAAARQTTLAGVVTSGTDVCLPALGALVDELGLIGPSHHSAMLSTNKVLMKHAFKRGGVPTAKFVVVDTFEAGKNAAKKIGYPVMVKATDTSGSRGICKVENESAIAAGWENAVKVSRNGHILIEQFIDGIEFGVQAFVCGSELVEIFPHNDQVTPPPIQTPIGHSMPFTFNELNLNDVKQVTENAVKSLQIRDAVCNVDLMLHEGSVKVLEIGARMGATCLPENISTYAGENVYEYLIRRAVGESATYKVTQNQPNASRLLRSLNDGTVQSVLIPEWIKQCELVVDVAVDVKPGDRVKKFLVGPDRVGSIVVKGESAGAAEALSERVEKHIEIRII